MKTSEFVKEIIEDIKLHKRNWQKTSCGTGISNHSMRIDSVGNSAILSICNLYIGETHMPLTYLDKYKLEKAVNWWYKNINLASLNA